jgi:hypothetical protein
VWTAQIGEVVGPVQTQAGFHVIEVVDEDHARGRRAPRRQQVQQLVAGELDARFFTAVSETEVQVDPAFGVWSSDPEDARSSRATRSERHPPEQRRTSSV